jgi:hypothetical protein
MRLFALIALIAQPVVKRQPPDSWLSALTAQFDYLRSARCAESSKGAKRAGQ